MVEIETTTSMVLSGKESLEPRQFEIPDLDDGGALLKVGTTAVCGTDIGLYNGQSHFEALPLILGHEVAGRLVEGNRKTLEKWGLEIGDRVMPEPYIPCYDCPDCQTGNYHMCNKDRCYGVSISASEPPYLWGGYGEYMYLHPNTRLHTITNGVSDRAACLGSVIGNGVRWVVTKGEISVGDSVAIIGPGAQGLATTIVADEAGADPLLLMGLSSDEHRLELGSKFGATHTLFTDNPNVEDRAKRLTKGGPDVVIITAPAAPAVNLGIDIVRERGTIVLPGLIDDDVSINTDKLVVNEVSLIGGRGQALNVERAMKILERRPDDVEAINTHIFSIEDAEKAIHKQLPGEHQDREIVHAALEPGRT